jgi:hypothetical protein
MAVGMSRPYPGNLNVRMVVLISNSEIYVVGKVCALNLVRSASVSTVLGCDYV